MVTKKQTISRIGVIGTFCLDQIYPYGEEKVTGLGGIYYSLVVLSHLFEDEGRIFPFVHVGNDLYPKISKIFRNYHNIDRIGLIEVPFPNNRVTNKYYSPKERDEFSTFVPPPLRFEEIDCSRNFDAFFINFISGKEMKISTLQKLRKNLTCPLYIDVHALVMGFREEGRRFFRRPPKWKDIIACGDILQMNDREAKVLAGSSSGSDIDFKKIGFTFLDFGPRIILFTLGEKGSILCYRNGRKKFFVPIEPYSIGRTKEVTGCGDVFAGGFILRYLQTGDPVISASFASKVAGIKAGFKGSRNLYRIHQYLISQ